MATRATKKEEVVQETQVKAEPVVILTQKLQLQINDRKVLNVHPLAKRVVIENLFGGDLYVSDKSLEITEENVVRQGETKEFKEVPYIYAGCFSRPVFTLTHFSV